MGGVREQTEVGVDTEGIRLERRQRPLLFYDAREIETIRELSQQEGPSSTGAIRRSCGSWR